MSAHEARRQLRSAERDLLTAESLMDSLIDSDPQVVALQRELRALEALASPSAPLDPLGLVQPQFAGPHDAQPIAAHPSDTEIRRRVMATLREIRARTTHLREAPSLERDRLSEAQRRRDQAQAALAEGPVEEERLLGIMDWAEDCARIKRAAQGRSIVRLWHFTRRCNLPSIMIHGLVTRAEIDRGLIPHATVNDSQRLDNLRESVSLSISHPNYRMFYSYRQGYGPDSNWCVIGLDPAVLWQHKCLYCTVNASAAGMVEHAQESGQTEPAFQALFEDPVMTRASSRTPRIALELEDSHPSSPQAEVLVCGRISAQYIREIAVSDQWTWVALENDLRRHGLFDQCRLLSVNEQVFDRRRDWRYWQ